MNAELWNIGTGRERRDLLPAPSPLPRPSADATVPGGAPIPARVVPVAHGDMQCVEPGAANDQDRSS